MSDPDRPRPSHAPAAPSTQHAEPADPDGPGKPGDPARGALLKTLEGVENLPTLPQVVARVLALAEDPAVSARQIADMIGQDQALAAAVLKLVNAPFYGLSRRISSIHHAVLLLGFRTVRNLSLSAVLVKSFGEPSLDHRFDRMRLWRHAVACATGARLLASKLGTDDAEEAFLAGLVHDMGIVVLDQFFHEGFRRVLDLVIAMDMPLRDAETEVFGQDHAAVGKLLARRWNFPAAVSEAIARHHEPWKAKRDPSLAAIVHVADGWRPGSAVMSESGDDETPAMPAPEDDSFWDRETVDPRALEILRLGPEDLAHFREGLEAEWERAQTLLTLAP